MYPDQWAVTTFEFEGTFDNSDGDQEILFLETGNPVALGYFGVIVPLALDIGLASGASPTANEHIKLELDWLEDLTSIATATGTGTVISDTTPGQLPDFASTGIDRREAFIGTVQTCTEVHKLWGQGWNMQIPLNYKWDPDSRKMTFISDSGSTAGTRSDAIALRALNGPSADVAVKGVLTLATLGLFTT